MTIQKFLDCLQSTGIFPSEEVATIRAGLPPEKASQDADELARLLVAKAS